MKVCGFTIGGKPVVTDQFYTVAITDYIAQGGDHITAFHSKGIRLPRSEQDPPSKTSRCVLEYLKQRPNKYYEPILEKRVEYVLPNNLDGQIHSFI
jgi:2',3'-cyclic-nucleotide 2'-phosphodiesterase (5'-nucleotidase family)